MASEIDNISHTLLTHPAIKKINLLQGHADGNKNYRRAKEAIQTGWPALTEAQINDYLKKGYWIGGVIAPGYIVLDVDNREKGRVIYEGLLKAGYSFIGIETPNGYQFIFRDIDRIKNQGSKRLTLCGIVVDYRLAKKGYIVLPTNNTENRKVIHLSEKELDPMPLCFLSVRREKEIDEELNKIFEGSRTTTFISHASKIREWNIAHSLNLTSEEKKQVLHEINSILCYPPLPQFDIEKILKSSESYPVISTPKEKDKPFTVLTKFYARPFTDEILKEHRFVYEGDRRDFYRYDQRKGLWINNAQDYITHYFRKLTNTIDDTLKKKYVISEIVADIQGCTWKPEGLPEPAINLIPCKNGVYDLKHDVFRGFQAADYFTWKIPFNYNPDAKCPFLERMINTTLPTEDNITLWELMAYVLYRGYPLHKFYLLVGPGSNGKGTFITVLIRMLGPENVANISLTDIQNNRFAASNLYRKLVNTSGEMSYVDIKDTALLKQLTGGDQIEADMKFKNPVKFVNFAKLIFSTNQVPKTFDNTDAFYRRAFIISFPYKFIIDPSFDIKIREDSEEMTREYEGLFFKTLGNLKVLMKNNFIFKRDQDIETVRGKYNYLSNPLVQFVDECCERTYQDSDYIFKYEFSQKLNEWIIERKMNTYSQEKTGKEMKNLGHKDTRKESPDKEKRYFAWVGLKWKPSDSVKGVKDVKVVYNSSDLYIEGVVNSPANPANPANPDTSDVIEVLGVI